MAEEAFEEAFEETTEPIAEEDFQELAEEEALDAELEEVAAEEGEGDVLAADEETFAELEEEPPAEEEDAPVDDEACEEHLKDAVEGSFRLKRMLSGDAEGGPAAKARKLESSSLSPAMQAKARSLALRWGLMQDSAVMYALNSISDEELGHLADTNYAPSKFEQRKSPSELVAGKVNDYRERKLPGGNFLDIVSAFRFRWKLTIEGDKKLRALSHKDLRHVLTNYKEGCNLDDLLDEASAEMPEGEDTMSAAPDFPGVLTMSRFNRLELFDPMADCATFGDANLTFSLLIAAHRKELGHVGRVMATTFEEIETLRERYKEIDESIKILEDHDAEVYHGVDCTRIALDPRFKEMQGTLGAIYYNYPHSGAISRFFDSHPMVNWRHENLMRLFFRALRSFVKPGGTVKVASNKGAVGVRYSYIVGSAIENEFIHTETMPFLEWKLHRYGRSYGDRRDVYKRPDAKNNESYNAQNAHNDMVYCFEYRPSGQSLGQQLIRMPPSLQTLQMCNDGPFQNLQGAGKLALAKQLHSRFITEVTGTHVG